MKMKELKKKTTPWKIRKVRRINLKDVKGHYPKYILRRIKLNKNFIYVILGPTGSGKSWSALRTGEMLDPDFDFRNVCFTGLQFMDLIEGKIKPLQKGSVILFDEIQLSLGHLNFQSLQNRVLNSVIQTFRNKNFIFIVTTQYMKFIDSNARLLFHCMSTTEGILKKRCQVRLKPRLIQVNQKTGKPYFKRLRVWTDEDGEVPINFWNVAKPSQKLIDDYETAREVFTTRLNKDLRRDLVKFEESQKEARKPLTDQQKEILRHLMAGHLINDVCKVMQKSPQLIYEQLILIKKKGVRIRPMKDGQKVMRYNVEGFRED